MFVVSVLRIAAAAGACLRVVVAASSAVRGCGTPPPCRCRCVPAPSIAVDNGRAGLLLHPTPRYPTVVAIEPLFMSSSLVLTPASWLLAGIAAAPVPADLLPILVTVAVVLQCLLGRFWGLPLS